MAHVKINNLPDSQGGDGGQQRQRRISHGAAAAAGSINTHRTLRISGARTFLLACVIIFAMFRIFAAGAHAQGTGACGDAAVAARFPGAEAVVAPAALQMKIGFDDHAVACVGIVSRDSGKVPDDVRANASLPAHGFWGPQGAVRERVLGTLHRGGGDRAAQAFSAPYSHAERTIRFVFLKERTAERELVTTVAFHAASYMLLLFRSAAGLPPASHLPYMATLFNTMPCEFRYCASASAGEPPADAARARRRGAPHRSEVAHLLASIIDSHANAGAYSNT